MNDLKAMSSEAIAEAYADLCCDIGKEFLGKDDGKEFVAELRRRDEAVQNLRWEAERMADSADDAGWHKSTTDALRSALAAFKEPAKPCAS